MRTYYRNNATGQEFAKYDELTNGLVLTTFDEKNGVANGNQENRFFVDPATLASDYTKIQFVSKMNITEKIDKNVRVTTLQIIKEMFNHGLFEEIDKMSDFDHMEDHFGGLRSIHDHGLRGLTFDKWTQDLLRGDHGDQFEYEEGYLSVLSFAYPLIEKLKLMAVNLNG